MIPAAQFIGQTLTGREVEMSVFWVYLSIPIGFSLLAVHVLISALRIALYPVPAKTAAPP